jgi:hypothetical protein
MKFQENRCALRNKQGLTLDRNPGPLVADSDGRGILPSWSAAVDSRRNVELDPWALPEESVFLYELAQEHVNVTFYRTLKRIRDQPGSLDQVS